MLARAVAAVVRTFLQLPAQSLEILSGGRQERDGLTLDAQLGFMVSTLNSLGLKESENLAKARKTFDAQLALVAPTPIEMKEVRDISVPRTEKDGAIKTRFYRPVTAPETPPLLVYFHGGGFVLGGLASHDAALRELAHNARIAVLAVDYRLAPEHLLPAAAEDAFAVYRWARDNDKALGIDATKVGVGGDSAGGNLSAVVTHMCRARGVMQPTVQLLIYPSTDSTLSTTSHEVFKEGFLLNRERIEFFLRSYLGKDGKRDDPRMSPLFEKDFSGLSPAIVVTAGFDPLKDEGKAYVDKLREAGVPVEFNCETSLTHGFFNMSGAITQARRANEWIARKLATSFK